MKSLFTILFSMTLFTSCQRNNNVANEPAYLPAKTLLNVAYGSDTLQRMDVYLPAGRSLDSTNALILIHGGGWNGGSKSEFLSYIDSFQRRMPGYAIFNLNYRLVNGGNLFPTQEIDVKAAIDFIVRQSGSWRVSADRMALLGTSAGGHLALLQAYKYNEPRIRAVVDFFGPTDLIAMYERPWHPLVPYALQMVTGTTPVQNGDLYRQSSPVNYIDRSSAPTLILHGEADPVVDISQSRLLKNKLAAAGVKHELVAYPGEGHGWRGATLTRSFDTIERFLRENMPE
jgi:acetyl esterase/lipase